MGYVPQFKNDIFISYRHASNEGQDRWVDVFCDRLRLRLKELVGDLAIWRDKAEIRASDEWRDEIAEALDAAIFLAIVSKTYMDSDVCRTEMDNFLGRVKRVKDAPSATRPRVFSILKQPTEPDQAPPPELGEFQHVEFFQFDPPGSRHFQEFSPGQDEETQRLFWKTLERLAQDLMDALHDLKGDARKHSIGTVYLAEAGPELRPQRESLRADLQQRGYLVVPERRYMWNASDLLEKMARDVEAADLCIHQVARTASNEPETAERARLQLERAVQSMKSRRKPPPLVWIQPAKDTDRGAQALIAYIENDLSNQGVEYWEGSLEDFKTHVYDTLPATPAAAADAAAPGEIALIVEEQDLAAAEAITDFLEAETDVKVNRIKCSGPAAKNPSAMARTLASCGKCIVFRGVQSEEWVKGILTLEPLSRYAGNARLCVIAAGPASWQAELREFVRPPGPVR